MGAVTERSDAFRTLPKSLNPYPSDTLCAIRSTFSPLASFCADESLSFTHRGLVLHGFATPRSSLEVKKYTDFTNSNTSGYIIS